MEEGAEKRFPCRKPEFPKPGLHHSGSMEKLRKPGIWQSEAGLKHSQVGMLHSESGLLYS